MCVGSEIRLQRISEHDLGAVLPGTNEALSAKTLDKRIAELRAKITQLNQYLGRSAHIQGNVNRAQKMVLVDKHSKQLQLLKKAKNVLSEGQAEFGSIRAGLKNPNERYLTWSEVYDYNLSRQKGEEPPTETKASHVAAKEFKSKSMLQPKTVQLSEVKKKSVQTNNSSTVCNYCPEITLGLSLTVLGIKVANVMIQNHLYCNVPNDLHG